MDNLPTVVGNVFILFILYTAHLDEKAFSEPVLGLYVVLKSGLILLELVFFNIYILETFVCFCLSLVLKRIFELYLF